MSQKSFNRREFLKRLGAAAASTAALTIIPIDALSKGGLSTLRPYSPDTPLPGGVGGNSKMTYRKNRHSGDEVSILGFGMMRLPSRDRRIDQPQALLCVVIHARNGWWPRNSPTSAKTTGQQSGRKPCTSGRSRSSAWRLSTTICSTMSARAVLTRSWPASSTTA